ncbi:MAG: hypothetical protein HOC91_16795 [Nitrospinaceae bacterium]|jgi:hypothetical protein|nr:hypothetical protein [Nitrospinaceae bacterium]MBT3434229.1 hypothetical protein [Nitrospinaceae bacterium]MBT3822963.1 hypothetical protein [Nitrospinaceae bacterium]MBT4095477.1 hypothetical protein [Nitrospinaceae bacterium]MBT4432170.1 hypothetical protein [Nitrospinaceae bacterium]
MEYVSLGAVTIIVVTAFAFSLWPMFQEASAYDASGVGDGDGAGEDVARLLIERENAYRNIREVEMDREMDKLADEDYEEMIDQARAGALDVLRRLEARGVSEGMVPAHLSEGGAVDVAYLPEVTSAVAKSGAGELSLNERLEAEIHQYRKVRSEGEQGVADKSGAEAEISAAMNFCPSCGAPIKGEHNFCSSCGNNLK